MLRLYSMSCEAVGNSLFTLTTEFLGYRCEKNFNAFVGVVTLNSFLVLLSIFINTRRYQEERRLLNVRRKSREWKAHFWKFLGLVALSNIIYVLNFLLLVESNFTQIVVVVFVRVFGFYALHQLNFVEQDFKSYDRVDLN